MGVRGLRAQGIQCLIDLRARRSATGFQALLRISIFAIELDFLGEQAVSPVERTSPRIAIVGTGTTGLVCAAILAEHGVMPVLFEKSRGIGGRLATRRTEGLSFDHGAPGIPDSENGLRDFLKSRGQDTDLAHWTSVSGQEFTGRPGMSGLLRQLVPSIPPRFSHEVSALREIDRGVQLDIGTATDVFDTVILTVPQPQACRLLGLDHPLARRMSAVRMAPCWTLLVAFAEPRSEWPDTETSDGHPFAQIIRNSSKPGRDKAPETWIAHASAEWSRSHLEDERETVRDRLFQALAIRHGPLPEPVYLAAHRWRYARAEAPLGLSCIQSNSGRVLIGGDWCLGDTADHAFQSGKALAQAALSGW